MAIADVLRRSRLLHFVVAGGILFALAPKERSASSLHVTTGEIERAWRTEQVRVGHLLSADEKRRVVDELVEDLVLYREGRRLGVDGSDPVVRARVAESMRGQLAAAVTAPDPAAIDREAAALAAAAPIRTRARFWFVAKDRPEALRIARALAAADDSPRSPDRPPLEDDVFYTEDAIVRTAGVEVAHAAFATPLGTTSPPVSSAWGLWVVRPLERRSLDPAEVRAAAEAVVRHRQARVDLDRVVEHAGADVVVDMPLGEPPYRRGRTTGEAETM